LKGKYIITGGPGTGKTSVLKEIQERGYTCHSEFARAVIKEHLDKGIDVFPWNKMRLFSDEVLRRMKELMENLNEDQICFFDRGACDLIAYMKFADEPVPEHYMDEIGKMNYAPTVFYLPMWDEIYMTDNERRESLEEARAIGAMLKETYLELGFEVIEVPQMSVEERVDYILSHIN
jgi:predicted ATPase